MGPKVMVDAVLKGLSRGLFVPRSTLVRCKSGTRPRAGYSGQPPARSSPAMASPYRVSQGSIRSTVAQCFPTSGA